ncbi:MAG: tetraacyldisaccharide 4'-kinase [Candidatus Acidiferrales bacterium]
MDLSPAIQVLLWPLSLLYGSYVRLRAWCYARGWFKQNRLRGKVISVGNLTVGGTGKTPVVIWLAERLLGEGKRVAILSRGYRGAKGTSDEIELMKQRFQKRVAFGVGKNRYVQGQRLEAQQDIDVFLLDDGFQHLQLARDLDIVLMDASRQIAKERLLPAGQLREPLSALGRADLIVFTRIENAPGAREAIQRLGKFPVFAAETQLRGFRLFGGDTAVFPADSLGPGPFFVFCGIGNPGAFFRDLGKWDLPVTGSRSFRDHHRYVSDDILLLERAGAQANAKAFLTTEKDAHNLTGLALPSLPVYVAVIDLEILPEAEFLAVIGRTMQERGGVTA